MIKIFISHKNEDSLIARNIASELKVINIPYYLDVLDFEIIESGKELTDHIKKNLNDCTDIIVVMSSITQYSQWVPFEIGMAAQNDMPTATFLQENVAVPDFLEYWPRLKQPSDIKKYVSVRKEIQKEYSSKHLFESFEPHTSQIAKFYDVLKQRL
jgi:hypothetical protein